MDNQTYTRKLTPAEHKFFRSPVFIITMIAKIKGEVTKDNFNNAVLKAQQRHPLLRCRIKEDENKKFYFTSETTKEIEIEIIPRKTQDQWITVHNEKHTLPFDFENTPPIRFVLLQSAEESELIIFCHHVICDGKSLAYLIRDIMSYLGTPSVEPEILPDPIPMDSRTIPKGVNVNPIVKFFIRKFNKKWLKEKVHFTHEDYLNLNEAYWKNYTQQIIPLVLSEDQTKILTERCKREGVTVNSALTLAYAGAEQMVNISPKKNHLICIVGSLRERLAKKIGEVMGFYAGFTTLKYQYNAKLDFWENARKFHKKAAKRYSAKNIIEETLTFQHVDTSYIDAITYKVYGHLVDPSAPSFEKLSAFSKRNDVLSNILKKRGITDADSIINGTMMTNLTRLGFPQTYGSLELVHLIMNPGVSAHFNVIVGALTCSKKLSVLITNNQKNVTREKLETVMDTALSLLSIP